MALSSDLGQNGINANITQSAKARRVLGINSTPLSPRQPIPSVPLLPVEAEEAAVAPEREPPSETAGSPRDPYPPSPTDSELEPFIKAVQERRRKWAEKRGYPFLDTDSTGRKWINFQYVVGETSEVPAASASNHEAKDEEALEVSESSTQEEDLDRFRSGSEEAADSLWEEEYSPSEGSHGQWLREEDRIRPNPSEGDLLEEEWVEGLHDQNQGLYYRGNLTNLIQKTEMVY